MLLKRGAEDFVAVNDRLDSALQQFTLKVAFYEDGSKRMVLVPLPLLVQPKTSLLRGKHEAFGNFALHHCLLNWKWLCLETRF
jgi:hypothetical protein